MRKIMDKNSEIIRTEVIRILNESGKIRSNELAKRVIKKVGSEKTVYREISELVESGEIERTIHSRSHIEYELINLHESCLLYTSPSPRDLSTSRMPSSA